MDGIVWFDTNLKTAALVISVEESRSRVGSFPLQDLSLAPMKVYNIVLLRFYRKLL